MRPERFSPNAIFGTAHYSEVIVGEDDLVEGVHPDAYASTNDMRIASTPTGQRIIPIMNGESITVTTENGNQYDIADLTYSGQHRRRGNKGVTQVKEVDAIGTSADVIDTIHPGKQWEGSGFIVRRPTQRP